MIEQIVFCILCGVLNRARGSQLFSLVSSTVIGRLVSMFGIALATGLLTFNGNWFRFDCILLEMFAGLMLWCSFAWDKWWSITIGHDPLHSRLYGLLHFGIRMALAVPVVVGLAYLTNHPSNALYALTTPLLAVPYYIWGYLLPQQNGKYVILASELTAGTMLGALICVVGI